MKMTTLGDVIVTRKLEVLNEEGNVAGNILIKIGKPVDVEIGESYCAYQIIGGGKEEIRCAMGVDALQALIIAMTKIGTDIYTLPEVQNGRVTWMEDKSGNLGVPVITEAFGERVPQPTMRLIL